MALGAKMIYQAAHEIWVGGAHAIASQIMKRNIHTHYVYHIY